MIKAIIAGGPSTGKSTTFELLPGLYPDAHFVSEPAELVIGSELARAAEEDGYKPILPTENYPAFAPLVIAKSIELEAAIPAGADIVIQDRSHIDNIGYGTYNNYTDLFPEIRRHIEAARYTIAFFCDWLGKFVPTEVRRESGASEALAIHQALELAYHESGVDVVHLPAVDVGHRLAIIRNYLG